MAESGDESGLLRKRLLGGGLAVVAAILGFYFWDDYTVPGSIIDTPMVPASVSPEKNNPVNDPPAPPERAAILGDLKVGATLAEWTVKAITISTKAEESGALTVALAKGNKFFAVWIRPRAATKIVTPHQTRDYLFFPGMLVATEKDETAAPIAQLLKRVRTFEGSPEPPPTMSSACPPGSASASAPASAGPAGSSAPAPGH